MSLRVERTGFRVPRVVVGTVSLGNLFRVTSQNEKRLLVRTWLEHLEPPFVFDTAGKYGAGLALEELGQALRDLSVAPEDVYVSNKLGWARVPLVTAEPTFEPGAWFGLQHDAVQRLGRDGIMQCYRQGDDLLGSPYASSFVSVHDPDEYLAAATSETDLQRRRDDLFRAYEALRELTDRNERLLGVGVGSKTWQTIAEIAQRVDLDWVMFANSLTVYTHPPELLSLVSELASRGVWVLNSALFHAGFLLGGNYFDYREIDPQLPADRIRLQYRDRLDRLCQTHGVSCLDVCVQFGLCVPGVHSVAVSTSRADRVGELIEATRQKIPDAFWLAAREEGLIQVRPVAAD